MSISIESYDFSLDRYIDIEIKGEVKQPKVITTTLGTKLNEILSQVELTNDAYIDDLPLLENVYDKQVITIPKDRKCNLISINTANIYELSALPGIGKSTAKSIIDYRETYGDFVNLDDLTNVNGIGIKKYEKIKPYICL